MLDNAAAPGELPHTDEKPMEALEPGGLSAGEEGGNNQEEGTAAPSGSSPPSRHHASGECSSGESNTRAKRSASCATHFKAGSEATARRPGSGGGGDASGSGSREGSGQEDGPCSAQQAPPRAPPAKTPAGRNGKHKLARPEGKLPCPRCASEDTKFCYYNNYNIKQPRYFCKACQRYWTAGGILRNVPIGAGRRKSKSSAAREQEKASAAAVAKQAVQARHVATNAAGLLQPGTLPPPLHAMPGPHTDPSASDLLQPPGAANTAYAEQLRYMMDPSAAQLAVAMGNPALGSGGMLGAPLGGIPGAGGGFDPSIGLMPPGGGMLGMSGGGMAISAAMGTPRLSDASGAVLASGMAGPTGGFNPNTMVAGDALHAPPAGMRTPATEDGSGSDGRRVRAKLDHSGSAGDPMAANATGTPTLADQLGGSGSGGLGTGVGDAGERAGGGEERQADWAAAAQVAERQQQAFSMQAAQAQFAAVQQAAFQAQAAQLQAAAAGWPQMGPNQYGMPGLGAWPYPAGAYGMANPNWAAAAQLNARFGNFGGPVGSEAAGSTGGKGPSGGVMQPCMMPTGGDGSGDISASVLMGMGSAGMGSATSMGMAGMMPNAGMGSMGTGGMVGGMGAWSNMMPTGSQPGMVASWPPAPQWAPTADLTMPHNKHLAGNMSGGGGGGSLGSGNSAATGLNAPGI